MLTLGNTEMIALNQFLDIIGGGLNFEDLDTEAALDWPKHPDGQALLLRLLASGYKPAVDLAYYVISESIWHSESFMDNVMVVLRSLGRESQWWFCSIVYLRSIWKPSYSDLMATCLHSDILIVRERAIRILSSRTTSAFEDTVHYLIANGYCQDLEVGTEYAFMQTRNFEHKEVNNGDDVNFCEDLLLDTTVINRVIRALHIAHLLRNRRVDYIRDRVSEEDSLIFDNLRCAERIRGRSQ